MADRQKRAGLRRRLDHGVGFRQAPGHWLFDERRNAGRQKWQRDVMMLLGRHGDCDRVDHRQDLTRIECRTRVVRCRDFLRARPIRVYDRDELSAWKRRQDTGVMTPEMADAD